MITKVIICNQQLSITQLNTILEGLLPYRKIVCSTHAFFDTEIESLSESARAGCSFYNCADFFCDQDFWDIDNFALKRTKEKQPVSGRGGFNRFKIEMIERRSFLLNEKLRQKFGDIELFVVDGLGVSAIWWEGVGARRIDIRQRRNFLSNFYKKLRGIVGIWLASANWCEFFLQNEQVVLFSKITRISKRLTTNYKAIPFWKRLVILLSNKRIFPYKKNVIPACALHDLYRFKRPMLIFQDGYFPSNYSYGHLWEYESYYSFVPSNPFAKRWLESSSVKVCKFVEFHDQPMKVVGSIPINITNLLFALNHSGDWSSMINRSDICFMIKAIRLIAKSNTNLKIRVRTHPGMTNLMHDGVDSLQRIVDEIDSWGLAVEISYESLSHDIEWADIVISEYSQVLIDSWTIGKLGVSLNLTNRRSFMNDYNELGFINANSLNVLIGILNKSPHYLAQQQNIAVSLFNQRIESWL